MRPLLALAVLIALAGCARRQACRKVCREKFGMSVEMTEEMCSQSCEDLARRYGIREAQCRWLQSGGVGDPP